MKLAGVIAAALSLTALPSVSPAPAAAESFEVGFGDSSAVARKEDSSWWTTAAQDLRASIYRFQLAWANVAETKPTNAKDPNDPAYDWSETDEAVRVARRAGLQVEFSLYKAPAWAEGNKRPTTGYGTDGTEPPYPGSWRPRSVDFGQFGTALATRYNGTTEDPLYTLQKLERVSLYESWNEPNYKMFFSPQFEGTGALKKLVAPDYYRAIHNAFFRAVKAVQPTALVSTAGLGPYGASSQGSEIEPRLFVRNLLCLSGKSTALRKARYCPTRTQLDAISIHPYTVFGTPTTKAVNPDGGAFGNTPSFKQALDFAASHRTVLPRGPKQLWATEFGWLTNPPGRSTTTTLTLGVKPTTAGIYLSEGLHRLWTWGVSKAMHFNLRDDPDFPDGLYFWPDGSTTSSQAVAKASLRGFRFPLMTVGRRGAEGRAWSISPCRDDHASLSIQFNSRGRWTDAGRFTPDSTGLVDEPIQIPTSAKSVRGIATGTGCSERSIAMPIYSR